ncbi:MAG: hypothetical protein KDD35_11430, partial [Bdellovibrionales bacterium]|nr:hypothetical protein [Bdellovibrionales bacterium]
FLILLFLVGMVVTFRSVAAETNDSAKISSTVFCKFESGDVGTIIGRGEDYNKALADASEQCFDRRVSLFEKLRGKKIDEQRGLDFIDSCINITCS